MIQIIHSKKIEFIFAVARSVFGLLRFDPGFGAKRAIPLPAQRRPSAGNPRTRDRRKEADSPSPWFSFRRGLRQIPDVDGDVAEVLILQHDTPGRQEARLARGDSPFLDNPGDVLIFEEPYVPCIGMVSGLGVGRGHRRSVPLPGRLVTRTSELRVISSFPPGRPHLCAAAGQGIGRSQKGALSAHADPAHAPRGTQDIKERGLFQKPDQGLLHLFPILMERTRIRFRAVFQSPNAVRKWLSAFHGGHHPEDLDLLRREGEAKSATRSLPRLHESVFRQHLENFCSRGV